MTARRAVDPNTALAAERTLLAWVRTGLAMMGFGFVVARFGLFIRELAALGHMPVGSSPGLSLWIGTSLVLLGVAVTGLAGARHVRLIRRLARGEEAEVVSFLGVALAAALSLVGIAMVAYLLVLTPR